MEFSTENFHSYKASQQTNSVKNDRRTTDRLFTFVFPFLAIAWLEVCKSGFPANPILDGISKITILFVNAPVASSPGSLFIIPLLISTVGVFLYILLTEKMAKIFMYFGLILYAVTTITVTSPIVVRAMQIVQDLSQTLDDSIIWTCAVIVQICWPCVCVILMAVSIFSFFKVDKKVLCDITKDSCRAIICNPLIILFMGFITTLAYFLFLFIFNALVFNIFVDRYESLCYFYPIVIFLGGLCTLFFLRLFAFMVVSQYTINHYWKKDDKVSLLLGRSIVSISRNHIGTVIFASTIFFSSICAIIQAFMHKRSSKNKENCLLYFVSKVYLALRMSDFALVFSSIYGTGFLKSSKTTFDEVLRRPSLFLATLAVYEAVFIQIPLCLLIAGVHAAAGTVPVGDPRTGEAIMNISLILHGLFLPFIGFACLMSFAMEALLINKIIILNEDNTDFIEYSDTEKKAGISVVYNKPKLQTLNI